MSRRPNADSLDSPEALDNLAASYRMIAQTMATPPTRNRMLKMAAKFEAMANQKRAELERRRKESVAW
jgi:hypothetical protein